MSNESETATEELFGPVSVVIPYESVDEAVQMATASVYGLAANVWGTTPEALETGPRLRAGTVTINGGGGGMAATTRGVGTSRAVSDVKAALSGCESSSKSSIFSGHYRNRKQSGPKTGKGRS